MAALGEEHEELLLSVNGSEAIYAPGLFAVETASGLWKYVGLGKLREDDAARSHGDALALVDRFVDDAELFPEAFYIACRERHPVYDLLYVLTARRTGSALLTVDKRLAALAKKLGVPLAV